MRSVTWLTWSGCAQARAATTAARARLKSHCCLGLHCGRLLSGNLLNGTVPTCLFNLTKLIISVRGLSEITGGAFFTCPRVRVRGRWLGENQLRVPDLSGISNLVQLNEL